MCDFASFAETIEEKRSLGPIKPSYNDLTGEDIRGRHIDHRAIVLVSR